MSTNRTLNADSGEAILESVRAVWRKKAAGPIVRRPDGNTMLRYEDTTIENGMPVSISYWLVANPIPPHRARLATFSYAIAAKHRDCDLARCDLELLDRD